MANSDDEKVHDVIPLSEPEPERTMAHWLGRRCRQLREDKGVKTSEIVQWINGRNGQLDVSSLSNFETGKTWPQKLDAIVAAYAVTCGVEDGRKLWRAALKDYVRLGGAPLPNRNPSHAQHSVLLALEAAQRIQPYDGESQDTPTSTPRDEEAG